MVIAGSLLLILWLTKKVNNPLLFLGGFLADFGDRHAAAAPVIGVYLVDSDNGGAFVFAKHIV